MKINQTHCVTDFHSAQLKALGASLVALRISRGVTQLEAAIRANISRSTAALIEKGSASVAVGQIVRYVDSIAPNKTLLSFIQEDAHIKEFLIMTKPRVRASLKVTKAEQKALDAKLALFEA